MCRVLCSVSSLFLSSRESLGVNTRDPRVPEPRVNIARQMERFGHMEEGGGRTHKMFFLVRPLHARLVIFFPRKPMHSFMELVWRNILNYRIHYVQKINWTWHFQYEIFFIFLQETLKDQLPPWICRFPIIDIKSRLTSDVMRSDNNVMREQCNDWSWAW